MIFTIIMHGKVRYCYKRKYDTQTHVLLSDSCDYHQKSYANFQFNRIPKSSITFSVLHRSAQKIPHSIEKYPANNTKVNLAIIFTF